MHFHRECRKIASNLENPPGVATPEEEGRDRLGDLLWITDQERLLHTTKIDLETILSRFLTDRFLARQEARTLGQNNLGTLQAHFTP